KPLKFTVQQISTLREQAVKMKPFIENFEKTSTVVDLKDASSAIINSRDIYFDCVDFSYNEQQSIFKDFSFKIESDQIIVIIEATEKIQDTASSISKYTVLTCETSLPMAESSEASEGSSATLSAQLEAELHVSITVVPSQFTKLRKRLTP
ncbi:hypothetical protein AJ79_10295, partial [Helicocarpus griseus UAMH5409]